MNIIVTIKPTAGRIDRVCHICGDSYNGWNFIACQECESIHNYTVDLAY